MGLSRMLLSKWKRRRMRRRRIRRRQRSDDDDDKQVWKNYWQQVRESEGFDIVDIPNNDRGIMRTICGLIMPHTDIPENTSKYEKLSKYAKLAIKQYNCDKDVDYEFISLEKANARVVAGFEFYFTIKVKNPKADGDGYELFQALVWRGIEKVEVCFCRPKPEKPQPMPES